MQKLLMRPCSQCKSLLCFIFSQVFVACQAVELLREVASVEPVVYEQQQQADAAGVRSVAGFIAELADR